MLLKLCGFLLIVLLTIGSPWGEESEGGNEKTNGRKIGQLTTHADLHVCTIHVHVHAHVSAYINCWMEKVGSECISYKLYMYKGSIKQYTCIQATPS